ncbi:MAG: hypothetical protein IJQ28_02530, partial [Clostridia bacterium]|nr:hypothetical protein [Clostridia bacterium]
MKNLSAKAKRIYNLLEVRPCEQDSKGTYCTYPIKELAHDSHISIMSVRRSLKELVENNYISCKSAGNQAQKIYFEHSPTKNEHSNSENEHSNSENEHSNSESEHSNSESEHSNSESEHSNSESEHSNSESEHSN